MVIGTRGTNNAIPIKLPQSFKRDDLCRYSARP
jgi:hypothetical protein